jgi:NAD-dependent SIR2 family protein deacetylase
MKRNECVRCHQEKDDVRWRAIHGENQCAVCAGVLARARALRVPQCHDERVFGLRTLDKLHTIGTPDEIRAASAAFGMPLDRRRQRS